MIKIQNNIATREPLPSFLVGLSPESLRDLTWTDPQLGVSDCAWLPERDDTPELAENQTYDGTETLTIAADRKAVSVVRGIRAMTPEEIRQAYLAANPVPASVTRRQALQALRLSGILHKVQPAIDAIPDPMHRDLAQIEWDNSQVFERYRPLVIQIGTVIELDENGMDDLFRSASKL